MKRTPTRFLQTVIVLIGIGALAFLLWEPNVEGRNAHATLFETYFKDPFLAYAYIASIPFFTGLYQALKLLENIGRNEVFSQRSVNALRTIKYCAMLTVGFVLIGEIWILFFSGTDDRPPAVVMGGFIVLVSSIVASAAAVFERLLQSAVDIKSENDLTV